MSNEGSLEKLDEEDNDNGIGLRQVSNCHHSSLLLRHDSANERLHHDPHDNFGNKSSKSKIAGKSHGIAHSESIGGESVDSDYAIGEVGFSFIFSDFI